jgi:AcrR family transcriptional regulator
MVQDVRVSRNLTQADVAARAGVSRGTVSRLERGLVDCLTIGAVRAISRGLAMPSMVALGWRSPEIDRLRDRLHAAMVEQVASLLVDHGWEITPENSFNHYGERGSADLLALHIASGALLIVEIKSRLWDLQDMLFSVDRKRRVLPGLVARSAGRPPRAVGVVLVLPEMSTHRHMIERHAVTLKAAFPQRQVEVRHWLANPAGDLRGIWFLPIEHQNDIGQRSRRRRAPKRKTGTGPSAKRPSNQPIRGAEGAV